MVRQLGAKCPIPCRWPTPRERALVNDKFASELALLKSKPRPLLPAGVLMVDEVYLELLLPTTCSRDHASRTRRTLRNFLPKLVGEYSTRTGISGNISRFMSPSLSNSRSCWVRTFCEIRGIFSRRTLKRSGSRESMSHHKMTGFQRPPIRTSSCSMGHMLAMILALIFDSGNQVSIWFLVPFREYTRIDFAPEGLCLKGE